MVRGSAKSITRREIVTSARRWIGTPYHHQASCRGIGTDCLGLIRGIWRDLYGFEPEAPPPYTRDWAEVSAKHALIDAARRHLIERALGETEAGDVAVFRYRRGLPAKHVALFTSPHSMIHAVESARVSEVRLNDWWRRRMVAVFSFPGIQD